MKKLLLAFVLTMPFFYLKAQQNLLPAAGNVGIHTTTPTQALEVGGAGLFTGNALNVDNRVGTYILNGRIVSLSGASGNNLSIEGQQLMFYTGTSYTEKMRLTAAGKLGLGPVDPIDKFHLYTGPTAAYGTSGGITISDSYIAARLWDSYGGHDVGTLDLFNDQNQKVRLIADGNSYINGGNLGIGTANPDAGAKLHVAGGVLASAAFSSTSGSSGGIDYHGGGLRIFSMGASGSVKGSYTWVAKGADGSSSTPMMIDANGNIGMGVSTGLSEKLSVNGNIRAQKLIVTQTGWSDYVFSADYKLKSLPEVEAFIKENKHLPEVPSAKEVEEKGVSVGDNQALLLRKIEELTLYMIAQQKQIDGQAKEIKKLKRK